MISKAQKSLRHLKIDKVETWFEGGLFSEITLNGLPPMSYQHLHFSKLLASSKSNHDFLTLQPCLGCR